jgi:hypothetical protein
MIASEILGSEFADIVSEENKIVYLDTAGRSVLPSSVESAANTALKYCFLSFPMNSKMISFIRIIKEKDYSLA